MSLTSQHSKSLIDMSNTDASVLSAQYNNVATTPGQLGAIRGSGQFSTDFPLSSNWPLSNFNPNTSSYVQQIHPQGQSLWQADTQFPSYGTKWNLSEMMPVGQKTNNQWEYTKDQSSFPPGSKESLQGDPYLQYGLKANQSVITALNSLFFNEKNVQYLQKRIIDDIKQLTGVTIKPQSEDALLVIMNNKYQYSLYGWLPAMSTPHLALPRGEKPCSLTDRLTRLNQSVLQDTIKQILSGMNMYMQYYKDASSLPTPLSRPKAMTMKGSRVLQENVGLHSGNSRAIDSFNMRDNVIN